MRVEIDPEELLSLAELGKGALGGDSNDDEHDALFSIVEFLGGLRSQLQGQATSEADI